MSPTFHREQGESHRIATLPLQRPVETKKRFVSKYIIVTTTILITINQSSNLFLEKKGSIQ